MNCMEGTDDKHDLETVVDAQIIYNKITQIHDKWQSDSSEECSKEIFDLLEMRGKELKNNEDYDVLIQRLLNIRYVFQNSSKRNLMLYILLLEWAIHDLCLKVPDAYKKLNIMNGCRNAARSTPQRCHNSQDGDFYLMIAQRITSLLIHLHEYMMEVPIPPSLDLYKHETVGSTLVSIGNCYFCLSDFGKALNFIKRGLVLLNELSRDDTDIHLAHVIGHGIIAVVYMKIEDYVAAAGELLTYIEAVKEAVDITEEQRSRLLNSGENALRLAQIHQYSNP